MTEPSPAAPSTQIAPVPQSVQRPERPAANESLRETSPAGATPAPTISSRPTVADANAKTETAANDNRTPSASNDERSTQLSPAVGAQQEGRPSANPEPGREPAALGSLQPRAEIASKTGPVGRVETPVTPAPVSKAAATTHPVEADPQVSKLAAVAAEPRVVGPPIAMLSTSYSERLGVHPSAQVCLGHHDPTLHVGPVESACQRSLSCYVRP
jgi:hypothetical protein